MRRIFGLATAVAMVLVLVGAMPAAAGEPHAVTIEVNTVFATDPDPFTATGLGAACADGTVVDGKANVNFNRGTFVYAGFKVFTCDDNTGFVLRLNARFNPTSSVGSWAVVDSWGDVAGISGTGSLAGDNYGDGILDHYSGTIVTH
jgi:hypothetical protein